MAKILAVDDARDVLALLTRYLGGQGYEVITAQNGAEALPPVFGGCDLTSHQRR